MFCWHVYIHIFYSRPEKFIQNIIGTSRSIFSLLWSILVSINLYIYIHIFKRNVVKNGGNHWQIGIWNHMFLHFVRKSLFLKNKIALPIYTKYTWLISAHFQLFAVSLYYKTKKKQKILRIDTVNSIVNLQIYNQKQKTQDLQEQWHIPASS